VEESMFSKIITRPGTAVSNKTGSWRSGKKTKIFT